MNHGALLFLGVFLSVFVSWVGLVVAPHFQFGRQELVTLRGTGATYPPARSGEALQGAEIYRANGCNACHTQQVRPSGEGSDLARGWGVRRTVSRDYLRDQPVLLGQTRFGPDLANVGARETNTQALLLKLLNARIAMPGSTMPPHPFLFATRPLRAGAAPSPEALRLPDVFGPPARTQVLPTPEARALVAYLQSLRSDALFFEVFPPPQAKSAARAAGSGGPFATPSPAVMGSVTPIQ